MPTYNLMGDNYMDAEVMLFIGIYIFGLMLACVIAVVGMLWRNKK